MQVKDLTVDELKAIIRDTVAETLEDLMPDPDEGRELKAEVRQQLLEIRQRRAAGQQGIPLQEVIQKLGL